MTSVYSCITTTTNTQGTFPSLHRVPGALLPLIPFPPPSGFWQPLICFLSFAFSRLQKWNDIVCSLMDLASFTQHNGNASSTQHNGNIIHVVVGCISGLILFIDEFIIWIYCSLLIHLSFHEYLGSFQFQTVS